jgi:hypothetical protein
MPLWGSIDQSNNAPKYKILATSPNTGIDLYGTQVVGLDDGEIQSNHNVAHSGWVRVIRGTGAVSSITINSGGTLYSNSDTIKVSGGISNAAANVVTNGNGVITAVTLSTGGSGFPNTSVANLAITTSTGSAANLVPVLGGRAGRVQTEVLVTQTNMTANGSHL